MEQERWGKAFLDSLNLSTSGHHQDALRLMDEVIAEAVSEGEESWVFAFISHASIMSGQRDRSLLKHYYEQYLISRPENPRALYGLADVAMEDGQTTLAEQYAKRCYMALSQSDDKIVRKDLLELLLERWPELAGRS